MVCLRGLYAMSYVNKSWKLKNQKDSKYCGSNSDTEGFLNGKTDDELDYDDICKDAPHRSSVDSKNSFSWNTFLQDSSFEAAPVSCFQHSPMADVWDNVIVGMKVEVQNSDIHGIAYEFSDAFWVATVLKIAGYKVLLRYEGFGQDSSLDFWVNLCQDSVHPVGWCATQGKPLIPPATIQSKYVDWKEFLVKRLTGARTLPTDFNAQVKESVKPNFKVGHIIEVVDKTCISQMKIALVTNIVGRRLQLAYLDGAGRKVDDFFCFEKSPLIHPVGWSHRVGHSFIAPSYIKDNVIHGKDVKDSAPDYLFTCPPSVSTTAFEPGMKLEAVDPLNLSSICAASIMKVLKEGYLMIRIDSYEPDVNGSDWFCYHALSPYIFPVGFCEKNSLRLIPPKGHTAEFSWDAYLEDTGSIAAPLTCFQKTSDLNNSKQHHFQVGQRLEAVDLMDPKLICVATITHEVGRLLKIHFDGWEEDFDQWIDKRSPDVFPVGWCEVVQHKLEGPKVASNTNDTKTQIRNPDNTSKLKKKRKGRGRAKQVKYQRSARGRRHSKRVTDRPDYSLDDLSDFIDDSSNDDDSISNQCDSLHELSENLPVQSDAPSNISHDEDGLEPRNDVPYIPSKKMSSPSPQIHCEESSLSTKFIPRIRDSSKAKLPIEVNPSTWTVLDVAQFLRVNDCATYCDNFGDQKIDGSQLMKLSKDQLLELTCMKVGPSLKIYDLIQQLNLRLHPAIWRQNKFLQKS